MAANPKVVVIGGGTGTYTVLSGLKKYPLDLSVIVSMMDSGGSNRILRDEFGILPTSDLRQCIVALAGKDSNEIIRNLFTYRYTQGVGIEGMTFGNLFMAALTDIYGSQEKAIKKTCDLLEVEGEIIPVTYDNAHLIATYDDGSRVLGEHYIDEPDTKNAKRKIVELSLVPDASANKNAIRAIKNADLIVIGPGDLYTSVVCNFVVGGVAQAIRESRAKKVYVMNLMTKPGQTYGFGAKDHVVELEKYLGEHTIDYVIIDNTPKIPDSILAKYKKAGTAQVVDDLEGMHGLVLRRKLISRTIYEKNKSDKLTRSLIRHDSAKLARAIVELTQI